jgi:ribosomal protein S18 acetylase RimI-like enzyme
MLEAYTQAADAFTSTAEERASEPLSYWEKRIDDPAGLSAAFGAFMSPADGAGEALVGTVAIEFSAKPKTRHKALLIGMYVSPSARGSGAGRALLAAVLKHAEGRPGLLRANLTVTEGNAPAVHLYQSAGFEAYGVEPMAIRTPEGYKAKVQMGVSLPRR